LFSWCKIIDWGISASGDEMRAMDAFEYALGFKGFAQNSYQWI